MTKKSLTLLFVLVLSIMLVFAFSACGGNDTPVDTGSDTGSQGTTPSPDDDKGTDDGNGGNHGIGDSGTDNNNGELEPDYNDDNITGKFAFALDKESNTYIVIDIGTFSDTKIVIPNTYNGLPVTSIGEEAFYNCTSLTSITIPNSVTSIGECAFSGCTSLTSITIPNSVTSIGECAFSGCTSLTSVTIPDSVTSIGVSAFSGCTSLTSITIGVSVTSIRSYAFAGCTSLTSVIIGDSVTSIGYEAFSGCTSLTSVTIPDSVTSIGSLAFYGCESLVYNEYDNGYYLGNEENPYVVLVKAKDTSITSCAIHEKTKVIYYIAFNGCTSLTSITIPDSVTSIGEYAFRDCTSLTSVTFENTSGWYVTEIYGATSGKNVDVTGTFRNAKNLESTYNNYYWYRKTE